PKSVASVCRSQPTRRWLNRFRRPTDRSANRRARAPHHRDGKIFGSNFIATSKGQPDEKTTGTRAAFCLVADHGRFHAGSHDTSKNYRRRLHAAAFASIAQLSCGFYL